MSRRWSEGFEWNGTTIARLRQLWAEGMSTAAIARAMNVSKNAVVGKAHRLLLPPRPSPIKAGTGTPKGVSVRRVVPTLATLLGAPPAAVSAPLVRASRVLRVAKPAQPAGAPWSRKGGTRRAPAQRASVAPAPVQIAAASEAQRCAFLTGERRAYVQCDAARVAPSPYCPHHAGICFVSPVARPALVAQNA